MLSGKNCFLYHNGALAVGFFRQVMSLMQHKGSPKARNDPCVEAVP